MIKSCIFCGKWLWKKYYCESCNKKIIGFNVFYVGPIKVYGSCMYDNLTCQPILNLKYNNNPFMGKLIGKFIHEKVTIQWDFDYLIPIPIHWTKLLSRGYNQAEIIGHYLHKLTGIPLYDGLKKMDTTSQKNKNQKNRLEGPQFQLKQPIFNKKILIIDDVITTGTTLLAAYNLLSVNNKVESLVFNYNQKFISHWEKNHVNIWNNYYI